MSRDLSPLFNPKGVVVAGASTHPGKFGFVSLHNLLANGYEGNVFATNLEAENVLGVQTVDVGVPTFAMHSIRELAGRWDAFYLYRVFKQFYH